MFTENGKKNVYIWMKYVMCNYVGLLQRCEILYGIFYWSRNGNYWLILSPLNAKYRVSFMVVSCDVDQNII